MKAYAQSQVASSHGRRIFIPYYYITQGITRRMNLLSIDGRSNKDTGKCEGWEFSSQEMLANRFNEACEYLLGYGFEVVEHTGENTAEVWK